jgi:shikimate dehydrogenase
VIGFRDDWVDSFTDYSTNQPVNYSTISAVKLNIADMEASKHHNDHRIDGGAEIAALRRRIDDIDEQILELINRRLSAAQTIGKIKTQSGTAVVDNRREGRIYRRISSLNGGPLTTGSLYRIFRSIIAAGRAVQHRWGEIGEIPIYAVFGDPVGQSLSPVMHNSALAQTGLDGVYLAFRVEDIAAAVSGVRGLGMQGVSITIPHKISVIDHLDRIDPVAAQIGAVNTIVNRQGVLWGYNSDCAGAVEAMTEKTSISGKEVAVIGAGGAARAVGFGVKQQGGKLTIINRSRTRGEFLAHELDCEFKLLADIQRLPYQIIINTTSVGMYPGENDSPLNTDLLEDGMLVMDLVYNPLKTRFLTQAEKIGCITIDGIAIFVRQGAVQFELWTGKKAPVDVMRQVVLEALSK